MEERRMEDLVIDYLEGSLSGELKHYVEKKIEKDQHWKTEYEQMKSMFDQMDTATFYLPPSVIAEKFQLELNEAIKLQNSNSTRLNSNRWLWVAASLSFILLLTIIGVLLFQNQQQQKNLLAIQRQIDDNRTFLMETLSNQTSASVRLSGINTSQKVKWLDDELEQALVDTYLNDENTNVRLAALNALARFANKPSVRAQLVSSLELQTDPLVLIQLINVLVRIEEQSAVPNMKKIIESDQYQQFIKDEAEMGIMKLS